ncbi:MAG: CoA-binding protein [Dehalococcoidales bacterium]|nr:CoA-binding protein [Dehalococcoidales bacterium]
MENRILREFRNIAVVGLSANPERPSYRIASYLAEQGYNIIPVNPNTQEVLDKTSYPDLGSIPEKVDVVEIFRRPEDVMPVVEEAIKTGAKAVWMQEGIVNEEAAARARGAGLLVVMDKCMFKEHQRLIQEQNN